MAQEEEPNCKWITRLTKRILEAPVRFPDFTIDGNTSSWFSSTRSPSGSSSSPYGRRRPHIWSEPFGKPYLAAGIELQHTAPYSPQQNPTERANRTIKTMIAQNNCGDQKTWDDLLPEIMLAINTSVSDTTGFSLVFLVQGRLPRLPGGLYDQYMAEAEEIVLGERAEHSGQYPRRPHDADYIVHSPYNSEQSRATPPIAGGGDMEAFHGADADWGSDEESPTTAGLSGHRRDFRSRGQPPRRRGRRFTAAGER
ncbi:hypothetical protein ACLKA7_007786 [Drosophila subpalustris]